MVSGDAAMEHMTALSFAAPPLASNVLVALMVGLSLGRTVVPWLFDEAFALVPHHTIFSPLAAWPLPFSWNLVTAHLFEANLLKAAVSAPALFLLARTLERLWTPRQLGQHLAFATGCAGVVVFLGELVQIYRTQREKDFFAPLRGSCGMLAALAVGLRHSYPLEAVPLLPRNWGVQYQHLPVSITTLSMVLGLLGPRWLMPEWSFAPLGLFFAWLHLRYVMWFTHAAAHGDHSPDFCFAALFPAPVRPAVACVGAIVYGLASMVAPGLVRLRQQGEAETQGQGPVSVYGPAFTAASATPAACPPSTTAAFAGVPWPSGPATGGEVVPGGPGSKEYNARRAKALKLLDDNISSLLAPGGSPHPSLGLQKSPNRRRNDPLGTAGAAPEGAGDTDEPEGTKRAGDVELAAVSSDATDKQH